MTELPNLDWKVGADPLLIIWRELAAMMFASDLPLELVSLSFQSVFLALVSLPMTRGILLRLQ